MRPTKTCREGQEDLDFLKVEMAAIVAWGDTHEFSYHMPGRRATGWINFYNRPATESTADLKTFDTVVNTHRPRIDSTIYCYSGHQLPQDKKYHVVRAEPILNSSHPHLVHHMILYTCLQDLDPVFLNSTSTGPPVCASGMQQKGMCYSFWILWAVGGGPMQMPPEAGMPMGSSAQLNDMTTAKNVMLEIHYDNPDKVQITDNSGFRLFYTDKLRDNDAVIMTLGHLSINIPAGATSHEHVNTCGGECTGRLKKPITALWAGLHMHSQGKSIWTQHFRGNEELAPLGHKSAWDFNQQSPSHVKAVINPGDRLVTHCVYNAENKNTKTGFGEGTDDEMCFNFLMVYPADGILMCMDMGPIMATKDSAKMGICVDSTSPDSLANVFGLGMGGSGGMQDTLDSLAKITIPFAPEPKEVPAYQDPVCAARRKPITEAEQSPAHNLRPFSGGWLYAVVTVAAASSMLMS